MRPLSRCLAFVSILLASSIPAIANLELIVITDTFDVLSLGDKTEPKKISVDIRFYIINSGSSPITVVSNYRISQIERSSKWVGITKTIRELAEIPVKPSPSELGLVELEPEQLVFIGESHFVIPLSDQEKDIVIDFYCGEELRLFYPNLSVGEFTKTIKPIYGRKLGRAQLEDQLRSNAKSGERAEDN